MFINNGTGKTKHPEIASILLHFWAQKWNNKK
jgi:hypothetical protein